MSISEADNPVVEEIAFVGEITINGETAPITFRVSAGPDCRLDFDVDPVNTQTYLLAVRRLGQSGTRIEEFAIAGKSVDGKIVASERASVSRHGSDSDGHWIGLSSRACKLTFPLGHPICKPFLRLWFRSFKAFVNPVIETSLGRLVVRGTATNVSSDDVSGWVALEAPSHDPDANWYRDADSFLTHMHRGLALAHGGRLQTPLLEYVHGSTSEATFFEGAGFTPELPIQYYLNQGPFIEALAERYERVGQLPEILWTALSWMQTDTTFDETRFLTAMTALEAIIESELPTLCGTVVPKEDFKPLREKIKALLAKNDTLSEDAHQILVGKVAQLNQKTFSQKIHALFDHYAIPKQDFEGDVIRELVKLRNNIVHTGVVPNEITLWPSIILVRELITRILLKEIGFVGRYCCYVGGLNDREFPDDSG